MRKAAFYTAGDDVLQARRLTSVHYMELKALAPVKRAVTLKRTYMKNFPEKSALKNAVPLVCRPLLIVMVLAFFDALEQVALPDGMEKIAAGVCCGCPALAEVTVGSRVSRIGSTAFSLCIGMARFESNAATAPEVKSNAFASIPLDQFELVVPYGAAAGYKQAETWKDFGKVTEKSAAVSFTTALGQGSDIYIGVKSSEKFAVRYGDDVMVEYEAGDYSALGKRIKGTVKGPEIEICGNADAISSLSLVQQKVSRIDISGLRNLTDLNLSENLLDAIDLTGFKYLQKLQIAHNGLKEISLARNLELQEVRMNNNEITKIVLPEKSAALKKLVVSCNPVSELDLSGKPELTAFEADSCLLRTVDILANTKLEEIDMDANELESIVFGDHKELWWVYLSGNKIKDIDVTGLPSLSNLNVENNMLTFIDLTQNSSLRELYLSGNKTGNVDLSGNAGMMRLYVNGCGMTALDTRLFDRLSTLEAAENMIETIDLSNNARLKNLLVGGNRLAVLDLSANTKLEKLEADHNRLAKVTLNAGGKFVKCLLHDNNLDTEMLDAVFAALPDISNVVLSPEIPYHKTITVFGNEGAASCNSMLAVNKGWNVKKDIPTGIGSSAQEPEVRVVRDGCSLCVSGFESGTKCQVFSISGGMVLSDTVKSPHTVIDVSSLNRGCYILKVGRYTVKFIM